jgi:hypothetical protein
VDQLGGRKSKNLPEEFGLEDRLKLDDLVLQLIGMKDPGRRTTFLERLYTEIAAMYRAIRGAEIEMQGIRQTIAKRNRRTPRSLAESIWQSIDKDSLQYFPRNFVPEGAKTEPIELRPAEELKMDTNLFNQAVVSNNGQLYALASPDRATFVARLLEEDFSGKIDVPLEAGICSAAISDYDEYRQKMETSFEESSAQYSSNRELQAKIVAELWKLHRAAQVAARNPSKRSVSA